MIRQSHKDLYFSLVRVAAVPNSLIARLRFRSVRKHPLKLHLGAGDRYIPGMINIEGNIARKKDLWLDLRNGLPFPDASAELIYCSHTLEHLYPEDAMHLLHEMRRVLRPTGVCRIAVPSAEHALEIAAGRAISSWPRAFEDPVSQAINYLFCDGQHRYAYSLSLIRRFAQAAGFTRITECGTARKAYGSLELGEEEPGSLVVELLVERGTS